MGAAKSTPVVTSAGVVNQVESVAVESEKVNNTYDRDEINKTVTAALAQTYEQIRSELEIGQALSLQRSEQLATQLKSKLIVPAAPLKKCPDEEFSVVSCLQSQRDNPTACSAMINLYEQCAAKAIKEKAGN